MFIQWNEITPLVSSVTFDQEYFLFYFFNLVSLLLTNSNIKGVRMLNKTHTTVLKCILCVEILFVDKIMESWASLVKCATFFRHKTFTSVKFDGRVLQLYILTGVTALNVRSTFSVCSHELHNRYNSMVASVKGCLSLCLVAVIYWWPEPSILHHFNWINS